MEENLERLLMCLEESEKQVLIHRYGLLDVKKKILKEVAALLGISSQTVRRLQRDAIKKISHPTKKKYAKNIANECLKRDIL